MQNAPSALAGFLAAALGMTSIALAPPSSASTTIQADSMVHTAGRTMSDSSTSSGTALALPPTSTASTLLSLDSASTVVIRAKASACGGAATMATSVDGITLTSTQLANGWSDYPISSAIPLGNHKLSITFTNAAGSPSSGCEQSLFLDTVTVVAGASSSQSATGSKIPFSATSPFNTKIPAGATVDAKSAAMIARATRTSALNANLVEFAIPIYTSGASTAGITMRCTISVWGPCPFDGYQIPIPGSAKPAAGSDGAMVIVDTSSRQVYEMWQASKDSKGAWTSSFGAVNDLDGSGWGGAGTGAGASRLAGVIRMSEIAAGTIPHALALQVDNACAGVYRAPALKTDGTASRSDCLPEGARVRLDPAVNLASMSLTPAERAVGKALQDYGGYVVDRGGAPLSVSFELDPTAAGGKSIGTTYQRAGLRWDYDSLAGLPLASLQVLS